MLTIDALREYGADVDEGLGRCFGNEEFYLRLVGMAVEDGGFEKLGPQIEAGDLGAAFETAHALKGVLANLALAPLLKPVAEATELLRARAQADYAPLVDLIVQEHARLKALAG